MIHIKVRFMIFEYLYTLPVQRLLLFNTGS